MKELGILFAIIIVGCLAIWIEIYKWKHCKNLGHETFYCLLSTGK